MTLLKKQLLTESYATSSGFICKWRWPLVEARPSQSYLFPSLSRLSIQLECITSFYAGCISNINVSCAFSIKTCDFIAHLHPPKTAKGSTISNHELKTLRSAAQFNHRLLRRLIKGLLCVRKGSVFFLTKATGRALNQLKLPKPFSPTTIGAYEYEAEIIYGRAIKTFNSRGRKRPWAAEQHCFSDASLSLSAHDTTAPIAR